ncbi:MAG: asparagine synthetase B family protein [Rhodocyclaceae bacterium]|nr:MAG: asparagine synthetase B family protein [Rhodocyclaceae bacterium]
MNRISFHQRDQTWQQTPKVDGHRLNLKGNAYLDNQAASATTLAAALVSTHSPDTLTALLPRMNGFYTWVEETPDSVRAAVDHIRSYPLFYAINNGDFFLSDDAEWVRRQVGDDEMDLIAREEFLLAGYVTGSDTLFPKVKQLQAGEYIQAHIGSDGIHVSTGRYYRFWHTEPVAYDETQLREKLEKITLDVMRRLIEQAADRQIVIPLSGGYDSRLIASMLKKLGYSNVLCFTYGVPGNKEAEYSRKVALALGFKWLFVEYSADIWRDAWSSPEADEYRRMAANHTSLPHVQDWLAIKKLLEDKLIEPDALIAPGHSGDFVAGSHIPDFVFSKDKHTQEDLLKALNENHLSNSPKSGMRLESSETLNFRLKSRVPENFDGTASGLANLYELWDWQERQAKYIVNSVRVYDQFSLQWWLPLWDIDFVKFWEGVPLQLRNKRSWFKSWISLVYSEQATGSDELKNLNNASDPPLIRGAIVKTAKKLPEPIKAMLKKPRAIFKQKNHFLAFEGLVPPNLLSIYIAKNYNIIGIYSDLFLNKIWGNLESKIQNKKS